MEHRRGLWIDELGPLVVVIRFFKDKLSSPKSAFQETGMFISELSVVFEEIGMYLKVFSMFNVELRMIF